MGKEISYLLEFKISFTYYIRYYASKKYFTSNLQFIKIY